MEPPSSPFHPPSQLEQLRKDARRSEHSIERGLNDFNRKLLLLKASGSAIVGSSSGNAEQQPLMQADAFVEAEATAVDLEQELQVPCLFACGIRWLFVFLHHFLSFSDCPKLLNAHPHRNEITSILLQLTRAAAAG